MPLFDFSCRRCAITCEAFQTVSEVGNPIICECGQPMEKATFSTTHSGVYRPEGAILSNGQLVKGLFGKDAPRRRTR